MKKGHRIVGFSLRVEPVWVELDAQGERCDGCSQVIIGNGHALVVQFDRIEDLKMKDCNTLLCRYCYDELKAAGH